MALVNIMLVGIIRVAGAFPDQKETPTERGQYF